MEIIKLPVALNFSLPLPIYHSVKIAQCVSKDGEEFVIYVGLSKDCVDVLKRLSMDRNDTELNLNTSDRERFGLGLYEKWYEKSRTPFALVHEKTKSLAALAWFGPKPLGRKSIKYLSDKEKLQDERKLGSENWHTISYRSYSPFRGKGLMRDFVTFTIDFYTTTFPNIRLWAGVYAKNPASANLAKTIGFKIVPELSNEAAGTLVMVKE